MGRARPFVCTLECVGMEIRWTARTRARGTVDCSSVVCARSTACRSGPHGTVDCSSVRLRALWDGRLLVRRLRAFDCSSVWPAWDGRLRVRRLRTFDCSSVWRAWDGRVLVRLSARVQLLLHVCARVTATARRVGMKNMGMKRRLRTSDCLSVMPAWENSPVSSVLVRLRLHDAWAWEAWAWKRHGAADGTSARACDEQDVVRVV